MVILTEAYNRKILSLLTRPSGEIWPATIFDLVSSNSHKVFSFETVKTDGSSFNGTFKLIPLLEMSYKKDPERNYFEREYRTLQNSEIHNTRLDPVGAAAEFLKVNKFGATTTENYFRVGNDVSKNIAFLNMAFTESFVPLLMSLYPNWLTSDSVEIPGFSLSLTWFANRGFLFDWFSNTIGQIVASGFTQAMQNHWRIWSPCSYLREVFLRLNILANSTNADANSLPEVSKCLRLGLSGRFVGTAKAAKFFKDDTQAAALSIIHLHGVFMLALYCFAIAISGFIFEWMVM